MKRWQKTIKCPKCSTANLLTARQEVTGNIKFNVDTSRIVCRNCKYDLRSIRLPYPFGVNEE